MKDNRIELYRFFAALVILLFHAQLLGKGFDPLINHGYVFTDFFFMLTGYFTYAHVLKMASQSNWHDDKDTILGYTFNKVARLAPYTVLTALFYCVSLCAFQIFIQNQTIESFLKAISSVPFDVLLLQITGLGINRHFDAWWYLSAIVFVLPLVYIIFRQSIAARGGGIHWLMLIAPTMIYGYFSMRLGYLDWKTVFVFVRSGWFRAIAGILLGGSAYLFARTLSNAGSFYIRFFYSIAEMLCFFSAFGLACEWIVVSRTDFLIVFFLFSGLVFSSSDTTFTARLKPIGFLGLLGRISVPLYICHYSIGRILGYYSDYYELPAFMRLALYFVLSFSFSIILELAHAHLIKIFKLDPWARNSAAVNTKNRG